MENTGDIFGALIDKMLEITGTCPRCEDKLYSWKTKNKDGTDRCAPTCMHCGYKDLKAKADAETNLRYIDNLKKRAVDMLKYRSVITDSELFDKTLDNYVTSDEESAQALGYAVEFVNEVVKGNSTHMILSGKSGVGKSHLSMAVCWAVLEDSKYNKKVLFINYRELLERRKASFNDKAENSNQISLLKDIKTVDFVVIDDLGAELGGSKYSDATNFNNDVLYSILEARQNKALIVNTNLTSKEIKAAYGERILSRMMKNAMRYSMQFNKAADKRIKGVRT